ncbi:MAG TPA: hypothetical protein P5536_04390 [Methanoregulaceae archaeon]|nr:MAG: hypothetical protein IPI71_01015 [Methanolinea sp.]HON80891.1 hypothetical protein [Methanoregulaceae archaeon]HRT15297.1 hypothetical protein [Methanoregulaceae archaeon]HRU30868.1 hypothetical protein [Methanoregulaceae archaeon]
MRAVVCEMSGSSEKSPRIRGLMVALICLVFAIGMAQAYELTIDAPTTLQRGMPLIVNGTSNIPPGTSVEVILSKSGYTLEEIAREMVTLQANQEFSVVFDTIDLSRGIYKVEVPPISGYRYLGNSVTLRVIEMIDRSDELRFSAPLVQEMDGTLDVRGSIFGLKSSGVRIEATGPGQDIVFGPDYVSTKSDGSFQVEIPITDTGQYNVSFTDSKGYIGRVSVTVFEVPEPMTVTATAQPTLPVMSATGYASRDEPAVFSVQTGSEEVRVFTSSGIDWVMEYTDSSGAVQKVNVKGENEGEEILIDGNGEVLTVTVYPYKYSTSGDVTLFAQGASSVSAAAEQPPGTTGVGSAITKSAPLPLFAVIIAVFVVSFLLLRRRW